VADTAATPVAGTRELLLDAAERLFAQHGIGAVSLREIGLSANQRNNGAAQYHFGDKAGLVRAVFTRRAEQVNDRRNALLDAAGAVVGSAGLAPVLWCYVEPLAEQVAAGNWYVPFLSRLQAEHERDELLTPVPAELNTGYERVRRLVRGHCHGRLPKRVLASRWRVVVNLAIDALADHQAAGQSPPPLPLADFVVDLSEAMSGLLGAPSSLG